MRTNIISIGNSQGVRIPKVLLKESGLGRDIELQAKKNEIKIVPAKKKQKTSLNPLTLVSEASFAKDWLRPEEEEAWAMYQ